MNDGRRRSEQRNEFVQMTLLKMAIQLSKELRGKLVSGWRSSYLKKAWTGKTDHICKEQNFSHQLPQFSTQVCASRLFPVAKSKRASQVADREARHPLWCLQWSKSLTATGKCLKRHHLPGRQKSCPGSPKGLIWSKEIPTKRSLNGDLSRALEEPGLPGKWQSLRFETFKGREGRTLRIKPQELSSILDSQLNDLIGSHPLCTLLCAY